MGMLKHAMLKRRCKGQKYPNEIAWYLLEPNYVMSMLPVAPDMKSLGSLSQTLECFGAPSCSGRASGRNSVEGVINQRGAKERSILFACLKEEAAAPSVLTAPHSSGATGIATLQSLARNLGVMDWASAVTAVSENPIIPRNGE